MTAKLLARTTAVLATIDQALDDPYREAVDRLPGVAGSWWPCHHPEVVQIGASDLDVGRTPVPGLPMVLIGAARDATDCHQAMSDDLGCGWVCWADDPTWGTFCGAMPATDLGLCAYHHDQIVPQEATP